MSEHSIVHGDFAIERTFSVKPAKIFQAFADKEAKERWFKGPSDQEPNVHSMDFRIGGRESNSGKFHDGITHRFEATYYDIVPDKRIVYAYEMYLNDQRISVSLATIELIPDGGGTKLTLTEKGAFLDGLDQPTQREKGTHHLLDALEKSF
ncbi:MAG TPA: SRPBCC family protein [Candidatus Saccharimonadales bacterium]|nr:SRPBCC family protein [Candidatus Saccharimonadales bacterium]